MLSTRPAAASFNALSMNKIPTRGKLNTSARPNTERGAESDVSFLGPVGSAIRPALVRRNRPPNRPPRIAKSGILRRISQCLACG